MVTILAELFATISLKYLQAFLAREDLKDTVRLEIANGMLQYANRALQFKADALSRPDSGSSLHTQGGTITLPNHDAGTQGASDRDPMSH